MLIKIDVESDLYLDIQDLIKEGKYPDIYEFIKLAILNQIQEEKSDSRYSKDSEQKIRDVLSHSKDFSIIQKELQVKLDDLKKNLSDFEIDEHNFLKKTDDELIWIFYNRFLPIKIIISELARLITPELQWIELEEFKENAVDVAQDMCSILKKYEIKNHLTRNNKLSVGLPTHPNELEGIKRKKERMRIENKISSGKRRFMNQFVGRWNKKEEQFEGACFSMGLMAVKLLGNNVLISLTDLGKEFALLENPVLNNYKFKNAFSYEETKFICEKIIPQFKLELQIIKDVISELQKRGTLTSKEIHPIFNEHKKLIYEFYSNVPEELDVKKKQSIIEQARVATMGRLSELGIVDWTSDSSGISHYSLSKEKSELLGL